MISWNANSLFPKRQEFNEYLIENGIDIALIQETCLKPQTLYKVPNYKIYRQDRVNRIGGGTAILIKKNIPHELITPPNTDPRIEVTAIRVIHQEGDIEIVSAYKPPGTYLRRTDLDTLFNSPYPTIIAGDLNAKSVKWGCKSTNAAGKTLNDYCIEKGLEVLAPIEPTHFHHITPDILDIAITKNCPQSISIKNLNDLASSDHTPIAIQISNLLLNPESHTINTTNWQNFKKKLLENKITFVPANDPNNIEETLVALTKNIQTALQETSSTIKIKTKNPFLLPTYIKEKIRARNKLKRRAKLTRDPHINNQANQKTKEINKLINNYKNEKWENFLSNLNEEDHLTNLWKTQKSLLNKNKTREMPPIHSANHGIVYQDKAKAEAFADSLELQFTTNETMDYDQDDEIRIHNTMEKINEKHEPHRREAIKTTKKDLQQIIQNFNNKKAPGIDKINNKTLKNLPDEYLEILSSIFNNCFKISYFPSLWKTAIVILLPKSGKNLTFPQNWRPISLLPTLGKLLEIVFLEKLKEITEENNLLPDEQFGFRSHLSTELQLARITQEITDGFNKKEITGMILLDVEKAFDKVWHEGLLYKLHKNQSIPPNFTHFIKQFLNERKFQVRVNNSTSTTRPIEAGVPQGSPLSPILFNLYQADIPKSPQTKISLFADDTCIFTSFRNPDSITTAIQNHLDQIQEWANSWKIKINAEKTQAIAITNKWARPQLENLTIDDIDIPWQDTVKYLGIHLDRRLNFNYNTQQKLKICNATYHQLRPLLQPKSHLNLKNKFLIYNQVIRPKLLYGSTAFFNQNNTNMKKLQTLQNKILRRITNAPWFLRNTDIHEDLQAESIKEFLIRKYTKFKEAIIQTSNQTLKNTFHIERRRNDKFKNLFEDIP